MKKIFFKIIAAVAIASIMLTISVGAVGDIENFDSYIYSANGEVIAAPAPYEYSGSITAESLGLAGTMEIVELERDQNDNIYILDSLNARVLILDKDYNLLKVIKEFSFEGNIHTFSKPQGLCVSNEGELYVADTENKRIVCFDNSGNCTALLGKPQGEDVQIDYDYYPTKIQVDEFGNLYVIARDQTLGILRITTNGEYCGYLGATRVIPSAWQILLRQFATEEQLSGLMNFIPTEYSNMDIDENGFLYCVVGTLNTKDVLSDIETNGTTAAPIRKLNQEGEDILVRNGLFPPVGDISFGTSGNVTYDGISTLCDIAVYKNGIYSALDQKRGRIFTYDQNGNLLYVFGGRNSKKGGFLSASAILYHNDRLLVSCAKTGIVQIFEATDYASSIIEALGYFSSGDYKAEETVWNRLLREYRGNTVIYTGIGRMHYNNGEYKEALDAFRMADNKTYYSKALKAYIKQLGSKWAPALLLVAVVTVAAAVVAVKLFRKRRKQKENKTPTGFARRLYDCGKGIKYSFYVSLHPFDGFSDLKFEGKANLAAAIVLWIGAVAANIFRLWLTPYLFSTVDLSSSNIIVEGIIGISVPLILWCVSNWCFTTLMDGKGTFKDIFIFSCNCLLPLILIYPTVTGISYFLYEGSASFANMIITVAVVWMLFLFVVGTVTTHQYTLGKAMVSIALSLVGMLIIVFLIFLVVILVQQVFNFTAQLFTELIGSL